MNCKKSVIVEKINSIEIINKKLLNNKLIFFFGTKYINDPIENSQILEGNIKKFTLSNER